MEGTGLTNGSTQYEIPVDPMARWNHGDREAIARPQRRQGGALAAQDLPNSEYSVPVDPMELVQCDSCQ